MILLLLSCSTLWSMTTPFKEIDGEVDTTVVVPISIIRKANIKLIEGNYYREISYQKDTIICNLNDMVSLYSQSNEELHKQIIANEKINKDLQRSLNRKDKLNNILIGTTTVSLLGSIILFLIK